MEPKVYARQLLVGTKNIADAVDALLRDNPAAGENLRNSNQLGTTRAFLAANLAGADDWTKRLGALDAPRRAHVTRLTTFLQSSEGSAMDQADAEGTTLFDYVGKGVDLLVTRGQYTVPAAQLSRASNDPSVIENVVNRVVDLGGEGKGEPYADLKRYVKWIGFGAGGLFLLKLLSEFRR